MELLQLSQDFSVCKLSSVHAVDIERPFTFLSVTDDEISLVCEASAVPKNAIEIEPGWRCLKIAGVLDFSLVGIIAKLSSLLAEHSISVFVVSTFNTDYILLKSGQYIRAVDILRSDGYIIA